MVASLCYQNTNEPCVGHEATDVAFANGCHNAVARSTWSFVGAVRRINWNAVFDPNPLCLLRNRGNCFHSWLPTTHFIPEARCTEILRRTEAAKTHWPDIVRLLSRWWIDSHYFDRFKRSFFAAYRQSSRWAFSWRYNGGLRGNLKADVGDATNSDEWAANRCFHDRNG